MELNLFFTFSNSIGLKHNDFKLKKMFTRELGVFARGMMI